VIIVRPSTEEILFRSKHQEHEFGYPYQLGHESKDSVNDVQISYIGGLKEGDVVVCATDGLFDNVSDDDILAAALANKAKGSAAQILAVQLIKIAHENSMSNTVETPYSMSATAEYDMAFHGGKQDDITCVVGYLIPAK
jgi:protein phosphatase PTC7